MGAVYRAHDLMLGRTVAVKVLSDYRSADEDTVRRFNNEAQSAARLDHENIARVYYVGEHEGLNFIVFEFIDGINVRDLVRRRGPLSWEQAIDYALQVADALSHAADRGVVHRDIKPSNVIISTDGRAKLVDMGLARFSQLHVGQEDLTETGVTLGTFDYISPEQAKDPRAADTRSDLYSLGCTLYFMLSGHPPFPDGTVLQKLLSHSSDPPPDLRAIRSDVPDDVVSVIERMLAKDPDKRYQDPSELVGELLVVGRNHGLDLAGHSGAVWVTRDSTKPSFFQRHVPWALPVAVLVIAVLLLEWYSSRAGDVEPPQLVDRGSMVNDSASATPSHDDRHTTADSASNNNSSSIATATEADQESVPATNRTNSEIRDDEPDADDQGLRSRGEPTVTEDDNRVVRDGNDSAVEAFHPEDNSPTDPDEVNRVEPTNNLAAESATSRTENGDSIAVDDVDAREDRSADASYLIVGDFDPTSYDAGENIFFGSLSAACVKASSELSGVSEIRLRYDGRRDTLPITLREMDLTIKAEPGYRPVISFGAAAGLDSRRAMIQVIGGSLHMEGVEIELDLPEETNSGWSLFMLDTVDVMTLTKSVITVRGTHGIRAISSDREPTSLYGKVRVFELPPDNAFSEMEMPRAPEPVYTTVELTDSIIRGDATVVVAENALPFRFEWTNGLLATSQRLMRLGGIASQRSNDRSDKIEVILHQVTAVTDQGLVKVDAERGAYMDIMAVDVFGSNNIFRIDTAAPLIAFHGSRYIPMSQMMSRLFFGGKRNFHENVNIFWRLQRPDEYDESAFDREEYGFDMWRSRWVPEGSSSQDTIAAGHGQLTWKNSPNPSVPMYRRIPFDYMVDWRQNEGPLQGIEPGFDIKRLPRLSRTAEPK